MAEWCGWLEPNVRECCCENRVCVPRVDVGAGVERRGGRAVVVAERAVSHCQCCCGDDVFDERSSVGACLEWIAARAVIWG